MKTTFSNLNVYNLFKLGLDNIEKEHIDKKNSHIDQSRYLLITIKKM